MMEDKDDSLSMENVVKKDILNLSVKEDPLVIENVVERMISNLSDGDVQNCRLVCKMWQKEADRVLKSRDTVTVTSDRDIKHVLKRLKNDPDYWISELIVENIFIDTLLLAKLLQKVKSQLSKFMFGGGMMHQQEYEDMIRLVGENVVNLSVGELRSLVSNHDLKYFPVRHLESGELLVFPKIKHLKYSSSKITVSNSTLLSSAARMFPNLVSLYVCNLPCEKPSNFDNFKLKNLRYLTIDQTPNDIGLPNITPGLVKNNVQCLLKLELNLKDFILLNVNNSLDPELLKKFLESQKELEILKLSQRSIRRAVSASFNNLVEFFDKDFCRLPAPCPFPLSLPSIIAMEVTKPFVRNLNHVFISCPKLESIDFGFHENSNWNGILPGGKINPPVTLKKMNIFSIDLTSFKKIGSSVLSEQITELSIRLCDDALLRVVFEKFTNLEKLFVMDKTLTKPGMPARDDDFLSDAAFSGLSEEIVEREIGRIKKEIEIQELDALRTHPHIGYLKKLNHFEVQLSPLSPIKSIPLWGIRNLSELSFIIFEGKKFDESMVLTLLNYFGREKFYILSNPDVSKAHYAFVKKESESGHVVQERENKETLDFS